MIPLAYKVENNTIRLRIKQRSRKCINMSENIKANLKNILLKVRIGRKSRRLQQPVKRSVSHECNRIRKHLKNIFTPHETGSTRIPSF